MDYEHKVMEQAEFLRQQNMQVCGEGTVHVLDPKYAEDPEDWMPLLPWVQLVLGSEWLEIDPNERARTVALADRYLRDMIIQHSLQQLNAAITGGPFR